MENPKEIHDELKKDLELKESEIVVVHGIIFGNVITRGSSTLILHGIIRGNIRIENQSTVHLHGMVYGDVINNGGLLRHYGMIKGRLIKLSGQSIVQPKALICEGEN